MAYLVLKETWGRNKAFLGLRRTFLNIFGQKRVREEYVKGGFLVLRGGKGSGKTRELKKLAEWSQKLYGCDGVYVSGAESMTEIFKKFLSAEELKGRTMAEKVEMCLERAKELAVFIDDLDKISGHYKKDFIKGLIINCKAGAVAFEDEKHVYDSLLQEVRRKQKLRRGESLRVVELEAEEEIKDIGGIVGVVLVVVLALVFRMPEMILLAMALRYMVNEGRRKT